MKQFARNYTKAITPPYSRNDIPHLLATFISLVVITSGLLLLTPVGLPIKNTLLNKTLQTNSLAAVATPDLDVTYISRSPRYNRYCVVYNGGVPKLCGGTENQKRWPEVGETVTYKAHVANKGGAPVPESGFIYKWSVNGQVIDQGAYSQGLAIGTEVTFDFPRTWVQGDEKIVFSVEPLASSAPINSTGSATGTTSWTDFTSLNNSLSIGSLDLTFSILVEKGLYDIFNVTENGAGTYSFEDWIQWQLKEMNDRFSQAKFSNTSPNGIINRVRVEKIEVAENFDGGGVIQGSADPDVYFVDGSWKFSDGDDTNSRGKGGVWQNYVNIFAKQIDGGLIHELSHQLGVVDLYRMNIKNLEPGNPNRGLFVKDIYGNMIPHDQYPFPVFQTPGIMGGGETAPYKDWFESHTAGGLNSHSTHRRGFYGEYLFDTPAKTSIKALDPSGNPLANAVVKLYQKDIQSEDIDDTPELVATTNSEGVAVLTNRSVGEVTTATGHSLKANPFGQIDVVGRNGTMLLKVIKGGAEYLAFFRLHDLNLAYWAGQKDAATIELKTRLYNPVFSAKTGNITGTISNPTGVPISGAKIVTGTAKSRSSFSTDSTGVYVIANLTPGNYNLEISAQGYARQKVSVSVVAGQTALKDIVLQKR